MGRRGVTLNGPEGSSSIATPTLYHHQQRQQQQQQLQHHHHQQVVTSKESRDTYVRISNGEAIKVTW